MAGLLVSVRNATEAAAAEAGGADLIDIKEPRRGALGAASPTVVRSIVQQVGGRLPLSVALGELPDVADPAQLLDSSSIRFAKVGLACAPRKWRQDWRDLLSGFPAHVRAVAVAYADYGEAGAPPFLEVLEVGAQLGCTALLIDTFRKNRGGLLEHLKQAALRQVIELAREQGMITVVAGSLDVASIRTVLPLEPDFIAVRGAVCQGRRDGELDLQKVRHLAGLVGETERRDRRPWATA